MDLGSGFKLMHDRQKKPKFLLFKFENVAQMLLDIDDRIDIIEKVAPETKNIEGIDLVKLWRDLYKEIQGMWLSDSAIPFITLTKLQQVKFCFLADMTALFFLNNGDERDYPFLKTVSHFFEEVNILSGHTEIEERFLLLKKMLKEIDWV